MTHTHTILLYHQLSHAASTCKTLSFGDVHPISSHSPHRHNSQTISSHFPHRQSPHTLTINLPTAASTRNTLSSEMYTQSPHRRNSQTISSHSRCTLLTDNLLTLSLHSHHRQSPHTRCTLLTDLAHRQSPHTLSALSSQT